MNLRATSWVLKGNQFAPLCTNNTYSQLDIMNDTDQCEENDHVIEFSIIITLAEIEFYTQPNRPACYSCGPWGRGDRVPADTMLVTPDGEQWLGLQLCATEQSLDRTLHCTRVQL